MFDHVTLLVKDFAKSKAFYEKALAPLGFKCLMGDGQTYSGFGIERPMLWIATPDDPKLNPTPTHIAFSGKNQDEVQTFYKAAMSAGGKDNGAPGYHTEYGGGHYAAFVFDLEGNNIEVVFRDWSKY